MSELAPAFAENLAALGLVLSGFSILLGARRAAGVLFLAALATIGLALLAFTLARAGREEWLWLAAAAAERIPWWVLAVALVVLGTVALRLLLIGLIGRPAADQAIGRIVGVLVLDLVRALVRLPLAALRVIVKPFR